MFNDKITNVFQEWWTEKGSWILPIKGHDYAEHAERVCEEFYDDFLKQMKSKPVNEIILSVFGLDSKDLPPMVSLRLELEPPNFIPYLYVKFEVKNAIELKRFKIVEE